LSALLMAPASTLDGVLVTSHARGQTGALGNPCGKLTRCGLSGIDGPAHDFARVGVLHDGAVHLALPGETFSDVDDLQHVRLQSGKAAVDQVGRGTRLMLRARPSAAGHAAAGTPGGAGRAHPRVLRRLRRHVRLAADHPGSVGGRLAGSENTVAKLMVELGLAGRTPGRRQLTRPGKRPVAPDLVRRRFTAVAPNVF
jgi:hypothetical protein